MVLYTYTLFIKGAREYKSIQGYRQSHAIAQ